MEYYLAFKNNILSHATTWMKLKDTMLSEIRQSPRKKYCMMSTVSKVVKLQKVKWWWSGAGRKWKSRIVQQIQCVSTTAIEKVLNLQELTIKFCIHGMQPLHLNALIKQSTKRMSFFQPRYDQKNFSKKINVKIRYLKIYKCTSKTKTKVGIKFGRLI